jgi:hypothetical protein
VNSNIQSPLAAKIAYARVDSWNHMAIWPWGYIKYDPYLEQLSESGQITQFRHYGYDDPTDSYHNIHMDQPDFTAIDANSWEKHDVLRQYVYDNFHKMAEFTYNIYTPDITVDGHEPSLKTWDKQSILDYMQRSIYDGNDNPFWDNGRFMTWDEILKKLPIAFPDNPQDYRDVWEHWLFLPGCDQINWTDSALGLEYWKTIKNCYFVNETMIDTHADYNLKQNPYNSCVLANGICTHSEQDTGSMDDRGMYIGPVYARILNVDTTYGNETVVIAFCTDGFGQNGKGQAVQSIIRFHLKMPRGYITMNKNISI